MKKVDRVLSQYRNLILSVNSVYYFIRLKIIIYEYILSTISRLQLRMNQLLPERQQFILQRFLPLRQLPIINTATVVEKKIYLLKNIYMEQKCVMKIQPKHLLESKQRNILHQASFFQKFQGHVGVPFMIWSGQDFDCLVLITQQLGHSLYDRMLNYCPGKKMRLKDACMVGIQLLDIIQNFHQKGHIHRNITPETFSFGIQSKVTKLYANDLIYMRKYMTKNGLNHIDFKQNVSMQFYSPFLSLNVLKGQQPSRRDDIISIAYVIIFLIKGKLPWQIDWKEEILSKSQSLQIQTTYKQQSNLNFVFQSIKNLYEKVMASFYDKFQRTRHIQQQVPLSTLCEGIPVQIQQILQMAYDLQFSEEPEYLRYKALLKKILFKNKLKNNFLYEWMESKQRMQTNLKIDKNVIIDFGTQRQRKILEQIYYPFEEKVRVDVAEQKAEKNRSEIKQKKDKQGLTGANNRLDKQFQSDSKQYGNKIRKGRGCQLI